MPRYRMNEESKAKNTPISLKPKHIEMLEFLAKHLHKNRSIVVQELIEEEYRRRQNQAGTSDNIDYLVHPLSNGFSKIL